MTFSVTGDEIGAASGQNLIPAVQRPEAIKLSHDPYYTEATRRRRQARNVCAAKNS